MRITVLGCGGSNGLPFIADQPGGAWGRCDPDEPRNRRSRASILIEEQGLRLLVDTGPDLRSQLLAAGIGTLDAVLYTHAHADHLHGIDDLRPVCRNRGRPLDIYASAATIEEIQRRFGYVLTPIEGDFFYKPWLIPHVISGPFHIGSVQVIPFVQDHGVGGTSLGFRINDFAYSTDLVRLDETAFAALDGIQVWIVDALHEAPHETHSHLAQTLSWIKRLAPQQAYLTHMNQNLDYHYARSLCPPNVEPAYDGLVIDL